MPNVSTITPGPDNTEHTPEGITETLPLITDVHADKESGRTNDTAEISDEEAYAKLKAKRAERRRKKLIRRGIAAGIVGVIALIAIVATLVINAQPQGDSGPATDMVTEGTFSTTVEAKGQLKPISSSVVSPSVDGTVDSINVQAGQSVNEGDVLMTIKKRRARSQRCRGAARSCSSSGRPRQRAESRNCRAGHPNDGRRRSFRSGWHLRRISGHERRIGRAAQPRIGPGKPRSGERQGRQPYDHGPELGQHRGAQRQGGRHGNRRHDHGRKRYERRQAVHADRRPI